MHLPRRLQDAWKVLWGRSEAQQEVLVIRAQWVELQAEMANMLAHINRWAMRVAKQEQRATAALATPEPEPLAPSPASSRKAHLRSLAAERLGLSRFREVAASTPVSLSSPPDENGEEP